MSHAVMGGYLAGRLYFLRVLLPVIGRQGHYLAGAVSFHSHSQAGRRIDAAAQQYNAFHMYSSFPSVR